MFDSASAIFWMYNDCWPMVRSWTIVDYYLRRTPSFAPVRRAFAPLTVAIAAENGKVCVFGINEGPAVEVEVRYGLFALAGGYPLDWRRTLFLPANASTLVGEFDQAAWEKLGERTHGAFALLTREGVEVAHEAFFLPLIKEMTWPRPAVAVRREKHRAVFSSETFALRVCLDLDGERALPDNFFDLLPGIPYELDWPPAAGEPKVLRVWNE
jgi:beta-mannosidase